MVQSSTFESITDSILMQSVTSGGYHPHLLVNCLDSEVDRLMSYLKQWCTSPFRYCTLPGPLVLPAERTGTLVLTRVDTLSIGQQVALYDWMSFGCSGVQIVSVTTTTLEALVESGRFLEGLFHRLNGVCLDAA